MGQAFGKRALGFKNDTIPIIHDAILNMSLDTVLLNHNKTRQTQTPLKVCDVLNQNRLDFYSTLKSRPMLGHTSNSHSAVIKNTNKVLNFM